jgi:hypothetical protein
MKEDARCGVLIAEMRTLLVIWLKEPIFWREIPQTKKPFSKIEKRLDT